MKKFLASLIFFCVLLISEMQLLHAFDMQDMDDHGGMEMSMKPSILCIESDQGKHEPVDCAKELIPDKSSVLSQNKESKVSISLHKNHTISFTPIVKEYRTNFLNTDYFYRYRFKSKGEYQSLIGTVVKNLN